jgi:hypothetical protein
MCVFLYEWHHCLFVRDLCILISWLLTAHVLFEWDHLWTFE